LSANKKRIARLGHNAPIVDRFKNRQQKSAASHAPIMQPCASKYTLAIAANGYTPLAMKGLHADIRCVLTVNVANSRME